MYVCVRDDSTLKGLSVSSESGRESSERDDVVHEFSPRARGSSSARLAGKERAREDDDEAVALADEEVCVDDEEVCLDEDEDEEGVEELVT